MKTYESIAIGIPDILLPKQGVDRGKWAVIACDQFTSEPKYWQKVSEIVGDAPSTLSMIYPEAYLGEKEPEARIERIRNSMRKYLDEGIFEEFRGFIYVERKLGANIRKGLVVCLDQHRRGAAVRHTRTADRPGSNLRIDRRQSAASYDPR